MDDFDLKLWLLREKIKCLGCERGFLSKSKLPVQCKACNGYVHLNIKCLKLTDNYNLDKSTYQCFLCEPRPEKPNIEKIHECNDCKYKTKRPRDLRRHLNSKHTTKNIPTIIKPKSTITNEVNSAREQVLQLEDLRNSLDETNDEEKLRNSVDETNDEEKREQYPAVHHDTINIKFDEALEQGENIASFLKSINMTEYLQSFQTAGIDLETLCLLYRYDIKHMCKELCIPFGHRMKLQRSIEMLQRSSHTAYYFKSKILRASFVREFLR